MRRRATMTLNRQSVRSMDAEIREEERRAARLAATYGPCATCGVNVGADGVHNWSCTAVPTDRRLNRGHAISLMRTEAERDAIANTTTEGR